MKSDQPAKKKTAGKVFDVRRPGRAPASATSKPVIVGHKPEVKDPDVKVKGAPVAADVAADVPATTPTDDSTRMMLGTHKKIDIRPVDSETITVTKKPSSKTPTEASVDAVDEQPAAAEPPKEEPKAETSTDEPAADTQDVQEEPAADKAEPKESADDSKADIDADVPADEEPATEVSDALAQVAIDGAEETEAEATAEPTAAADTAAAAQPAEPAPTAPEAEAPAAQPVPELKPDVQPAMPKPTPTTNLTTTTSKPEDPTAANAEVEADEDLSVSEDDMAGAEENIFVSHHDTGGQGWKVTLLILIMIFLLLVAFDILLDGGIVTIKGLPHSNFFSSLQ